MYFKFQLLVDIYLCCSITCQYFQFLHKPITQILIEALSKYECCKKATINGKDVFYLSLCIPHNVLELNISEALLWVRKGKKRL